MNALLKEAISIESRAAYGTESLDLEEIGTVTRGNRSYVLYKDTQGHIWYETTIATEKGNISLKEAVFSK